MGSVHKTTPTTLHSSPDKIYRQDDPDPDLGTYKVCKDFLFLFKDIKSDDQQY